ncbi:MAG: hypothetical protein HF314_18570 [Ignavibacteria bacterium]|jgi:hypothetical protein|nr:hypothetical protein [Ignavibacteria bacterium]MCU7505093.1 hypothetical protein [Ignavibacteria bacterium]MCU7518075.1 hypothetical protein [Ignavibacteria bacterium]
MNKNQIEALTGSAILIIAGFLPVAALKGGIITFFPVWHNLHLDNGLWNWLDIAFLVVSFAVLALLSFYFVIRKKYAGLLFSGILTLFISIIIFISIFFIQSSLNSWAGYDPISLSWGWLLLISGSVLLIMGGRVKKNISPR